MAKHDLNNYPLVRKLARTKINSHYYWGKNENRKGYLYTKIK